jgi:hypothetical protein
MMPTLSNILEQLAVLGRTRDLRDMSEGFRSVGYEDKAFETFVAAAIIVTICVTLILVGRYFRRFERLKTYDSPPELFRELCRVHRIDWADRRLLKRLAAEWEMTSPALLFIEPERFNAARLPEHWQENARQLEQLRHHLFGAL